MVGDESLECLVYVGFSFLPMQSLKIVSGK